MIYSHGLIEKKWQKIWQDLALFRTDIDDFSKPKFYILDMFPYPSGNGLHVGHIRGYLATDIITRMKMMQGYSVLHPLGFDSFGLPAEQYAIKTKKDPNIFTQKNINNFIEQLKVLGFTYDFEHPLITSEPAYYKTTQWIFGQFFDKKLAKIKEIEVNFCPGLNTVLANEEIIETDGKMLSERGSFAVFKKKQKQWTIDLAYFADSLLDGLKDLNWSESIKKSQKNWIGKENGYYFELAINEKTDQKIPFFLVDFSVLSQTTFVAISINNKLLDSILDFNQMKKLNDIRKEFEKKPAFGKKIIDKNPLFFTTNLTINHPITNKKLPISYVSYLDVDFATGTNFGAPRSSRQDWFLAKNAIFDGCNEKKVKISNEQKEANSQENFLKLKNNEINLEPKTYFHIRDWIFSRQRYWGEPFPVKYINNEVQLIHEEKLPLLLPKFSFDLWSNKKTKNDFNTPLAHSPNWIEQGFDANTMPQWAGSCWYFLGYILRTGDGNYLSLNSPEAKKKINFWMPVDLYVGGSEHAVSHLLYARSWNHFLSKKLKLFDSNEPFAKLINQGMILAEDGKKMSKSKGNIVNPNDFLISHGADAIRLHEKFLGPFSDSILWNEKGLFATRKWLARVWTLLKRDNDFWTSRELNTKEKLIQSKLISEITDSYEKFLFNVVIAKLMSFINYCYKAKVVPWKMGFNFLKLLHPLAPHLTEELSQQKNWTNQKSLVLTNWPKFKVQDLIENTTSLVVQINGKVKKTTIIPIGIEKNDAIMIAKDLISDFLIKQKIKKIVFVPNKIVNFVLMN